MKGTSDAQIFILAALCVFGLPIFWVEVWKMLKTQSFEDSKGQIVRASEKPFEFRFSMHLGFIVTCALTVAAFWIVREAVIRLST